jgi:hypothetical protein
VDLTGEGVPDDQLLLSELARHRRHVVARSVALRIDLNQRSKEKVSYRLIQVDALLLGDYSQRGSGTAVANKVGKVASRNSVSRIYSLDSVAQEGRDPRAKAESRS